MYSSFEIHNFRCFKNFNIGGLDRINLISGMNNVGKTAFLESLFLHCASHKADLTVTVNALRGMQNLKLEMGRQTESPIDSIFHFFDTTYPVELKGEDTTTGKRILILKKLDEVNELKEAFRVLQGEIYYQQFPLEEKATVTETENKIVDSSEAIKIFRLEEKLEGYKPNFFYMLIDLRGIRTFPPPPSPPFPCFSWPVIYAQLGKNYRSGMVP